MKTKNQIGQIGVITTQDSVTLWKVTRVDALGLIVCLCDNPQQSQNVSSENFWVLVDSL
jgi:hypothetical protein